ncbi:TPA: hypothetical protein NGS17_004542 [Vibrio parahaemolyticus]|nr:hypothetical protein [Vibrio parahaemolyticus]
MNRKEKHILGNNTQIPIGTRVAVLVSDSQFSRALISSLPVIGAYIDNVLTKKSQDFYQNRLDTYLESLSTRLDKLELQTVPIDDETISDLFQLVVEKVVRTRNSEKIKRFAGISANCLSGNVSWDETEAAVELINSISEPQMAILLAANSTEGYIQVSKLPLAFESLTEISSQLYCADLVSKGLLVDKGVSHLDGGAIELLSSSALNKWLLEKINVLDSFET